MKHGKPSTYDVGVLLKKMEHAETVNSLALYAEEAKTAPEVDKPILRAMYAARMKQLKAIGLEDRT